MTWTVSGEVGYGPVDRSNTTTSPSFDELSEPEQGQVVEALSCLNHLVQNGGFGQDGSFNLSGTGSDTSVTVTVSYTAAAVEETPAEETPAEEVPAEEAEPQHEGASIEPPPVPEPEAV